MGFLPSISGLSWFAVLSMTSLPPASISQAQPLPKRVDAGLGELLLEACRSRRTTTLIASPIAAGRLAALARAHDLPEHRVVDVTAAVVADGRLDVLGNAVDALDQLLDALLLQFRVLLERRVQVVDVGRVMLVVVDPHRLLVDVRLQRGVVVRKRRNFMSHLVSLLSSILSQTRSAARGARLGLGSGLGLGTDDSGADRGPEHAVERELGVALLVVGHDDLVVDLAFDEAFEDPQQVIRRDTEHRRAQAAERVERDNRLVRRHFVRSGG